MLRNLLVSGKKIYLVSGNHDCSARGDKVSSFTLLARVLSAEFEEQVTVFDIGQSGPVPAGWVVAHCQNVDLFQLELEKVLAMEYPPEYLFLHCNYASPFLAHSDNSLNLTEEMAQKLAALGITSVLGHEHQARAALKGKVVLLGNQVSSSVADCLNNNTKHAHVLRDGVLTKVETWNKDSEAGYAEVDWQDLATAPERAFIRVAGKASAAQASDVINAIAAFRQTSQAFVVTNAVQVAGIAEIADLPEQFEAASAFDVLDFIKKHLDADEVAVVESLLKD
jgi:hypothetical protein